VVERKQLAKDLTFDLLNKVVDGIAVDERPLFSIVRMQIEIKRESIIFYEVVGKLLDGKDGRLLVIGRVDVVSVEVLAEGVHSEVPVEHAIHVDHGDDHEDEHLFEQIGPQICVID